MIDCQICECRKSEESEAGDCSWKVLVYRTPGVEHWTGTERPYRDGHAPPAMPGEVRHLVLPNLIRFIRHDENAPVAGSEIDSLHPALTTAAQPEYAGVAKRDCHDGRPWNHVDGAVM